MPLMTPPAVPYGFNAVMVPSQVWHGKLTGLSRTCYKLYCSTKTTKILEAKAQKVHLADVTVRLPSHLSSSASSHIKVNTIYASHSVEEYQHSTVVSGPTEPETCMFLLLPVCFHEYSFHNLETTTAMAICRAVRIAKNCASIRLVRAQGY